MFLFQFMDRVLFEVELEFELTGGVTETGLEYAQLDFLLNDNITLTGGKFLVPFGVFGERLHPTWINKFPTSPPLYGHHVTEVRCGAAPSDSVRRGGDGPRRDRARVLAAGAQRIPRPGPGGRARR